AVAGPVGSDSAGIASPNGDVAEVVRLRGRRTLASSATAPMQGIPMPALILDGKALAATMQAELAAEVAERVREGGGRPGLAAVRIGDNEASATYVRNKILACSKAGFASFHHHLPETTSQTDLLKLIAQLNADHAVHAILVQLPLPKTMNENEILRAVDPR